MNQLYAWASPTKWELISLKYLFDVLNGATPSSSEMSYWDGNIFWATPEDIGSLGGKLITDTRRKITEDGYLNSGTQLAPAGSIVLTTRAPVGNLAVSTMPLCTNQGCKTLVPNSANIHVTYYYYHLLARKQELKILAKGTTFNELASDELRSFKLLSPSFEEQRAIADMLDRETVRLDELIAEKVRLLELLAEKRHALITHAVTRGLNNEATLRDSGIQWLGKIPAHWEVRRLKFACNSILTGNTPPSGFLESGDLMLNWFTPGDFKDKLELVDSTRKIHSSAIEENQATLFPSNAVFVVGIGATLGKVGVITNPASANQQINALIPLEDVNAFYLAYRLSTLNELMNALANSATLPILNQQRMGEILITIPPVEEQSAIVEYIESETKSLDELRDVTTDTIFLLNERRASLIAAAVMGQIPVETLQ